MSIIETRKDAITSAIAMIAEKGPKLLLNRVNFSLEEDGVETITPSELTGLLTLEGDPNDPAQVEFRLALSRWDQTTDAQWLSEAPKPATHPKGPERRSYVLGRLGFSEHEFDLINSAYPIINAGTIVANPTDDGRWPWYSSERRTRSHYWDVYQGYSNAADSLLKQSWRWTNQPQKSLAGSPTPHGTKPTRLKALS
ncbi:hypothetical protein GU243_08245 [Pseudarthrobacter psychrotolerans]|uniref:Uncharacterized protein n=1 Tax=Pseudarthrobacter psychrotolerans TaxID=2697569 RepID=A0A6P1NK52_9MICC|nr:hypothetical protein [Pseudarthrobacter psychrotolerans]QHK19718.1 hypothetical protein GU243_08245 [Pseudarthrobacter psychrotolerans]